MTAPLLRLKSLTLPSMPNAQLVAVLQLFLKRCRTVEILELPGLHSVVDGVSSVVTLTAELCRFTTDLLLPNEGCFDPTFRYPPEDRVDWPSLHLELDDTSGSDILRNFGDL
ncbi:hypothetical protein BGZ88_001397 [Linnemannia elongata]|nr:hypothetical protein BGZ88_001397 [Linnemannia elongata]